MNSARRYLLFAPLLLLLVGPWALDSFGSGYFGGGGGGAAGPTGPSGPSGPTGPTGPTPVITPVSFGTPPNIAVFNATNLGTYPGSACTPPALALSSNSAGVWTCATPVPASAVATATPASVGTPPVLQVAAASRGFAAYAPTPCAAPNVVASIDANGTQTCVPAGSTNITNVTGGVFLIPNKGTTGTTLNKLAKIDTTASPATVVIATTSDVANVLGPVVSGAGTTGSATIIGIGLAPCIFDNTATVGHYVIVSTSVAGDCSDSGSGTTFPTGVAVIGIAAASGSGTQQVAFNTPDIASVSSFQGKATVVAVNGTKSQSTGNLNGTTPAAGGGFVNVTWQSSTSGNTTSISGEVPVPTPQPTSTPAPTATPQTLGSTKPFLTWTANQAFLPATNFPNFSALNNRPVLNYGAGGSELCAYFGGVLPAGYAGGGLNVSIKWAALSATSGTGGWAAAFERLQDGTDNLTTDSFATQQTGSGAVPGTAGIIKYTTITFTNGGQIDSLAAGEAFRLEACRSTSDGVTGVLQILTVSVLEP